MISGIVNVYKEKGFTSFDVVAKMRGIYHQKKIGHTGVLLLSQRPTRETASSWACAARREISS